MSKNKIPVFNYATLSPEKEENIPVFQNAMPSESNVSIDWQIDIKNLTPSELRQLDQSLINELFDGDEDFFRSDLKEGANRHDWIALFEADLDAVTANLTQWLEKYLDYWKYIANKYAVNYEFHVQYTIPQNATRSPALTLSPAVLSALQQLQVKVVLSAELN